MTVDRVIRELERAWAVLSVPRSTELSSFQLTATSSGTVCRAALDRDGRRHLLVPAPGEAVTADQRPSVLTSSVRPLAFGGDSVVYVDVCCTEPDADDEFDDVVADLLVQLDSSTTPGATVLSGLARWRRLFRSRLERGLGPEARIGLFGELCMLRALIQRDPTLDVGTWTGPLRQPHDFEAVRGCVEVKTVGADAPSIRINGIDQLGTHDDRPLELVVLTVVPDADGTTLVDLIELVRSLVVDTESFDRRLRRVGWRSGDTADTDPLTIAGVLRVPITHAVPKLVPNSLVNGSIADGVNDLNYRIAVDELVVHGVAGNLADAAETAAG